MWTGCTLLAVVFLAALFVQVQQYLFRYRAEHLLADMQAVRLHQSTWQEAQILMQRWGAWGHYEGSCTWTNCTYKIEIANFLRSVNLKLPEGHWFLNCIRNETVAGIYRLMGGRFAQFSVGFIVQDGTIWRRSTWLEIELPPKGFHFVPDEPWGTLNLSAQSRQSLREPDDFNHGNWILGGNEQIADHPNYKSGRPDGCESCLEGDVTYAVQTPPEEYKWLTNYQFDCLTRRNPCQILEDVLPAAKEWHLYEPPFGLPNDQPATPNEGLPQSCRTPLWAIGRDAAEILDVSIISSKRIKSEDSGYEKAGVKLKSVLKGNVAWPPGTMLDVYPYLGDSNNEPTFAAEQLNADQTYLLVLYAPLDYHKGPRPEHEPNTTRLALNRCGVIEDLPQNRIELQKSFALNDDLRVREF